MTTRSPQPAPRPPSLLHGLLPPGAEAPSVTAVLGRLAEVGCSVSDVVSTGDLHWELALRVGGPDGAPLRDARMMLVPATRLAWIGRDWPGMTEADDDARRNADWSVGVELTLGEDVLGEHHRHLRLLAAAVPDLTVLADPVASRCVPGRWVRDAAASAVPPPPTALFGVHAVSGGGRASWLHTHGLARGGSIELDILDVPPSGVGDLHELLVSTATLFLDAGVPPPNEPFGVGEGLSLVWRPWERCMSGRRGKLGGPRDRDDEHGGERGVLLVPRFLPLGAFGRWFKADPPSVLLPALRDDPVLWVSSMETRRMELLAHERLPRFAALREAHAGRSGWRFLVKLGYDTDDGEPGGREHLWFEVHGLDLERGTVEATLLNAPQQVRRLREGHRGVHELERLTDWLVLSAEHGQRGPNEIDTLERSIGS